MIHLLTIQRKDIFVGFLLFATGVIIFPLHVCAEKTKQKDTACVQITKRDPFWPVGFVSKKLDQNNKTENTGLLDWDGAMNNVKINGYGTGTGSFVLINNIPKKIGDTVSVDYKGHHYEWIVESIADTVDSVKFKRVQ